MHSICCAFGGVLLCVIVSLFGFRGWFTAFGWLNFAYCVWWVYGCGVVVGWVYCFDLDCCCVIWAALILGLLFFYGSVFCVCLIVCELCSLVWCSGICVWWIYDEFGAAL